MIVMCSVFNMIMTYLASLFQKHDNYVKSEKSTQIDLLLEFQRYIQFGESEETDFRLLLASVEVINDIFFEALVLISWRLVHANFMSTPSNRMRRF